MTRHILRRPRVIRAGVTPLFVAFIGTDAEALAYVLRANRDRRHLTDPQRAIVAAKVQPFYEKLKKERMVEGAKARAEGPRDEKGRLTQGEVISPHPGDERAPQSRAQAAGS